ncbi:putative alpha/beta hydrolase [Collybia nuda]|uniref:Alpha/beta hydrolase n=1 Tax=Collybia nuda TaxID=64659 RepID=A0A9P5XXY8_9AGAR|nr:putative alpha/beta hydrolase [Collybia nuda]
METKFISLTSGITAAYRQAPANPNPANPTLVLLHSFLTSLELYGPQFNNSKLTSKVNLLAIDEIGHGKTKGPTGWSYWTTAQMVLDLTDALDIPKVYALGTSQGGFIVSRMAILRPDKVLGIIPIGSSVYAETEDTRELGCWNAPQVFPPWYRALYSPGPNSTFEAPSFFSDDLIDVGFGDVVTKEQHAYWTQSIRDTYRGDEGRKKMLMCTTCLGDRDSLEFRLPEITCPVLIPHGTKDRVYSVALAEKYAKLFTSAPSVLLKVIDEGQHFLSASHPKETDEIVLNWILDCEGKRLAYK